MPAVVGGPPKGLHFELPKVERNMRGPCLKIINMHTHTYMHTIQSHDIGVVSRICNPDGYTLCMCCAYALCVARLFVCNAYVYVHMIKMNLTEHIISHRMTSLWYMYVYVLMSIQTTCERGPSFLPSFLPSFIFCPSFLSSFSFRP